MNKLVITGIIAALAVIGAAFAAVPVQQASTTHLLSQNHLGQLICKTLTPGVQDGYNPVTNSCV